MPRPDSPTPDDGITGRLAALESELRAELASVATVERRLLAGDRISVVSITPTNPRSLHVSWQETLDELVVQAGHEGGFFELGDRAHGGVDFIRAVVRSVVAGSVIETFAPGRSHVRIEFPDGTIA